MQIILCSAFYVLNLPLVPRIGGNVEGRNQKLFAVEIESKASLRKRKVSNFRGKGDRKQFDGSHGYHKEI